MAPLTAEEVKKHPEYAGVVWDLKPAQSGNVLVGEGRGGPFNLAWEIHGNGPIKLVWIMGLGALIAAWQRQIKDFGHSQNTNRGQSPKYSCLFFDNRGMGKSDKPSMRYSTSEMAKDTIELINHVGWMQDKQLHVIGASMGGMIAQEMASMIYERIASLTLICTGPRLFNTVGFVQNLRDRINLIIPRSQDQQLAGAKARIFSAAWLDEPDAEGHFPTNGDRFAAQEIQKRSNPESFSSKGFFLQMIAAGWHHKSPYQIQTLADHVGRENIMVIHGDADRMITFPHGELLFKELGGEDRGVTFVRAVGRGHGLPMEWRRPMTKAIAEHIEKVVKMSRKPAVGEESASRAMST